MGYVKELAARMSDVTCCQISNWWPESYFEFI